jgi:hypothetical protein
MVQKFVKAKGPVSENVGWMFRNYGEDWAVYRLCIVLFGVYTSVFSEYVY